MTTEADRTLLLAANAIGYALEQHGITLPLEAAEAAAERLSAQGLLRP